MNLGLGNLIELKRYLLAGSLVGGADYDRAITAIGKGVAGLFNKHCNRVFERAAGAVDQFSADRRLWITRRYPIETIASIEQRDTMQGGWVALTLNDVIMNRDDAVGIIKFGAVQGSHQSEMRLTYTGGYWFDSTEADPPSEVPPGGATLLPGDVKEAWYLQCAEVWEKKDKLGTSITGSGGATFVAQLLAGLTLVPLVKEKLAGYIRYQVT
jgi:hypothetical protein